DQQQKTSPSRPPPGCRSFVMHHYLLSLLVIGFVGAATAFPPAPPAQSYAYSVSHYLPKVTESATFNRF
ncbi:hypothetical protein, partial [Pseudomonas sp.]|uniref:hypothetical protein n=1 Tax=Pseudomonas sp. TaxID=306 RepID=UPI003BAF3CAB